MEIKKTNKLNPSMNDYGKDGVRCVYVEGGKLGWAGNIHT